jgi:rod shape-determining protein MreB
MDSMNDSYTKKEYKRNKGLFLIIKLIIVAGCLLLISYLLYALVKIPLTPLAIVSLAVIFYVAFRFMYSFFKQNRSDVARNDKTWGKGLEVTEEMIAYLIKKAEQYSKKVLGPRVVVGVPSGVTNVEIRAVRDAARNAGAREVYIIEEPMAGAIGIRLPIHEPVGSMIIDIGGGTTDIAVISLGGIVRSRNLKVAGDKLNNDIISYIRNEFKILIGEKTAEKVKIAVGSVISKESLETTIRGRDLITGLPREVVITDSDIREATSSSMDTLVESAKEVLETTPPEILSDVMNRGIHLVGGGALIKGLDELLSTTLKLPVYVADDPLTAIARGTGIVLEDLEKFKDVLIQNEDELRTQK